jgi:hypothetical protein
VDKLDEVTKLLDAIFEVTDKDSANQSDGEDGGDEGSE